MENTDLLNKIDAAANRWFNSNKETATEQFLEEGRAGLKDGHADLAHLPEDWLASALGIW